MATAVLPPLLPTPPRSQMLPLLPTPCLIILPASFAPPSSRPGRAESVDRWDAGKIKPSSPASSSCGSWSPGRASTAERWDRGKKCPLGRASLCERWDSNKRPAASRSSSAERWDIHKKPRAQATNGHDDGKDSNAVTQTGRETGETQKDETKNVAKAARTETVALPPVFTGACFFPSPEPSTLPIPAFLRAC